VTGQSRWLVGRKRITQTGGGGGGEKDRATPDGQTQESFCRMGKKKEIMGGIEQGGKNQSLCKVIQGGVNV